MRSILVAEAIDVVRAGRLAWRRTGTDPGFVFDVDPGPGRFLCFVLKGERGEDGPKITFDRGNGFSDMSALALKSFPFAVYHLPVDRIPARARLLFSPRTPSGLFHFVAFQTSNAALVAILHYLFNLRYQAIGIIAPAATGRDGGWKSNVARITKFFADVARGSGVRVQESGEMLLGPALALSQKAADVEIRMHALHADASAPLLSFVAPTYDTPPAYLRDLVDSFALQAAPYAELILSDDGSTSPATRAALDLAAERPGVRLICAARNRGIAAATNAGIAVAKGVWIAFIDHDDAFVAGAAAIIADAISRYPDAHFFYTDELIVDRALKPIGAFLKPAFDSVLLSGMNYINHFSIYRRDRLNAIGGLREDREGSQDYDLLLRYLAGARAGTIIHIPYIAYLWRREATTYSHLNLGRSVASARRALQAAYAVKDRTIDVEPALDPTLHRIRFETQAPLVSVIIPNRDSPVLIARIVAQLRTRTAYASIEIVIVDNGSTDLETLEIYRTLDATIDIVDAPFNFAAMCNRGARLATGDVLLFLNNDIEVTEPGWLAEMVECLSFEATGIVGARLLYPNGTVQHNGVIVGLGDAAGHWYIEAEPEDPGPMGRLRVRQTFSAVTAACMLVTRACFEALDGFDADNFAIAYNDVDFCMRARALGVRTVWTPFATLIHHESLSRGSDQEGENNVRFRQEMARLQERHATRTMIDDAYSPFCDRRESRPHFVLPETLPALRPNVLP